MMNPMFQMAPKPFGNGILYRSDDYGRTWFPAALRKLYDDTLNEPVPDDLSKLAKKLR